MLDYTDCFQIQLFQTQLLNSVCFRFLKDFCIPIHKGYWLTVFLLSVWFGFPLLFSERLYRIGVL